MVRGKHDQSKEHVPELSLEHVAWLRLGGHGIHNPTSSASPYLDVTYTAGLHIRQRETNTTSIVFICTKTDTISKHLPIMLLLMAQALATNLAPLFCSGNMNLLAIAKYCRIPSYPSPVSTVLIWRASPLRRVQETEWRGRRERG